MSLINEMLRDLEEQKKKGAPQKQAPLKPKKMERIPFIPASWLVAGGGVLLLCLIWWLAGALSDMLFGVEPKPGTSLRQEVASTAPAAGVEQIEAQPPEPDQLTSEERAAEPVDAVVTRQQDAPAAPQVAERKADAKLGPSEPAGTQPVVVSSSPEPRPAAAKKVVKPRLKAPVAVKPKKPVQKVVAAPVPRRLHPDDLPGAVLSVQPSKPEPLQVISRPNRSEATTPYGMAEESYLDGLWALEKGRSRLAVSALQTALQVYPGHLPAREVLVETLAKEGKAGEAMLVLAEGLEIVPDYTAFKKKYASLLVTQGDYDAATKVMLNNGLPSVEADPEAHSLLASLYLKLGEPFLAAQTYRNLLVAWPQTGAFWVGLGSALENQELWDEAMDCYERALETKDLRDDLSRYAKRRLRQLG